MYSKRKVILLIVIMSITFALTSKAFAEEDLDYSKLTDKIDLLIKKKVEMYDVVGLSVGLVNEEGLIWSKGYGYENLEVEKEATDETLYRIASVTKTFTATGIMILRDRGLLKLDDPITEYLPDLSLNNTYNRAVTIRDILNHRSGLRRDLGLYFLSDKSKSSVIENLKGDTLLFKPGSDFSYSNVGYTLLGLIIENLTGTTYETFIQEEILSPLEMNNTYTELNQDNIDLVSRGYFSPVEYKKQVLEWLEEYDRDFTKEEEELFPLLPIIDKPAGSIISNIEDVSKYMSFILKGGTDGDGNQILSEDSIKEMYSSDWGLGWWIDIDNSIYHSGGIPPYNTYIRLDMDNKLGVVVFCNTELSGVAPAVIIAEDIAGTINLFRLGIDM